MKGDAKTTHITGVDLIEPAGSRARIVLGRE